jgi:hypothetical protein
LMEMLYFIRAHKYFIAFILFVNILLANLISKKIHVHINRHIYEALGGRDERASLYRRCISVVRNMVDKYERRGKKHGFYIRMKDKMRKSGYEREKAAAVYIILRFLLIPMFFLISVIISYPNVIRAITGTALIYMVIELVILTS